jgi:ribonuclease BN (tRNA processing enzyme)
MKTTITFLGTATVIPRAGSDSASFVINRRYLVDTGHSAGARMQVFGIQPREIEYVFLTHRHPDHALGLPQLISYRLGQKFFHPDTPLLQVVGPAGDLEELIRLSCRFIDYLNANGAESRDVAPESLNVRAVPLRSGEKLEEEAFQLTAWATQHNPHLRSLAYRFSDNLSGKTVGFTGDVSRQPDLAEFMAGIDLLIHDAGSYPAGKKPKAHASSMDAARIAAEAEVGRLCLIHFSEDTIDRATKEAKKLFPRVFRAREGKTIVV